ncbi:MAG: hypothetical protein IH897_14210 [Planctomycetes bacterium]|nr:hypothetical protein [Planctomycetota bacterium]
MAPARTRIYDRDALVALARLVEDGRTEEEGGAPGANPRFVLHTLLAGVAAHEELDLDTLTCHVRQSDATAADGYWHLSLNQARSFLEALLVGMLCNVCAQPADKQKGMSRNGTSFRRCGRRLLEAGFLDADENDLLQYVYSVASGKGSHHRVTDRAWTRLARRMVWTGWFGAGLWGRFTPWMAAGPRMAATLISRPTGPRV